MNARPGSPPQRPPTRAYSMSLLAEFLDGAPEPSYADAAAHRAAPADPHRRAYSSPAVLVTMTVMGLLFAIAWTNVRTTSTVLTQARTQLIDQIGAQQEHGDNQAAKAAAIQARIDEAQVAALGPSGQGGLLAEVTRLQVAAGAVAVTGPGVVVTLDDAPAADGNAGGQPRGGSGFGKNRVSAADLQIVVNGLWAAGAEAMSVNGQRLTARSAIRFAGEAILVDFRALARPYIVTAIGDPNGLTSAFGNSPAGSYLKALDDNFGIRTQIGTATMLTCPAGSAADLRYAQTQPSGIPSTRVTTAPDPTPSPQTSRVPTSKATPR